jgi:hypothetical protein
MRLPIINLTVQWSLGFKYCRMTNRLLRSGVDFLQSDADCSVCFAKLALRALSLSGMLTSLTSLTVQWRRAHGRDLQDRMC